MSPRAQRLVEHCCIMRDATPVGIYWTDQDQSQPFTSCTRGLRLDGHPTQLLISYLRGESQDLDHIRSRQRARELVHWLRERLLGCSKGSG